MSTTAYEGWAIVDLFGHAKLAGKVSEVQQYGTTMIRIDVPEVDGIAGFTTFKGGGAIYSLTPTTEEIAKGVIRRQRPQPVNTFDVDLRPKLGPVQDAVTVTPAGCKRCFDCMGESHHWIDNDEAEGEGEPDLVCKHCNATAFRCGTCSDGVVEAEDDICAECAARGADHDDDGPVVE